MRNGVPPPFVAVVVGQHQPHDADAQRQRLFDAVADARLLRRVDAHAVDDDLDRLFLSRVERLGGVQFDRASVDTDPRITLAAEARPRVSRRRAGRDLDRRGDQRFRPGRVRHHLVDDLVRRLGADRHAAIRAMHRAQPGHQDA